MPPTPVDLAGEAQGDEALRITSNRDPPPEMPRRRMKDPVLDRDMPPTPVDLAGEAQGDEALRIKLGWVCCDCGACHASNRIVTTRTRPRHRTMFKQIISLPTLPEEAVEDDKQHPDGEEEEEKSDSGSLEEADADGNLPDPEAVQEDLDHVDPEIVRNVKMEIEGKLMSLDNLADMEVTITV
ncbi:hypothetical protein CYMTET_52644 [Cymbomonas tetramitiformis]|uniref:Uncharacterized protein n=1 Tax=Cymbomonas tetramitiformis TaxID=36881 RepID=A0AAE0ERF7_9CHLO|nr:hypothetical protein CYMTET_52644 [Cymbomonas tetramitiformis]